SCSEIPLTSLSETHLLHDSSGCRVERRQNGVVVKFGRRVTVAERDALEYARTLQIPVPHLQDQQIQSAQHDQTESIWMDYIDGDNLEDVWPTMSPAQKKDIANQLGQILSSMRCRQSETGMIGSCNGGVVRDCRQLDVYTGGPFPDETSFNKFILDLFNATPTDIRNALAHHLRSDHRIVFTHGDLTQHNIIVKDNQIRALLDWEFAGWYPEYWEYVKFLDRHAKHRDWKDYAQYIFPEQYHEELIVYQALRRWQLQ
ncbi:uncharacterized protein K452DRAFT_238185, partial [Aplosporella prunicola CBS 121167]